MISKDPKGEEDILLKTWRSSLARVGTIFALLEDESGEGMILTQVWRKSGIKRRKDVKESVDELEILGFASTFKRDGNKYILLTKKGENFWKGYDQSILFNR